MFVKSFLSIGLASSLLVPTVSAAAVNPSSIFNNFITFSSQYSATLSQKTKDNIRSLSDDIGNLNTRIKDTTNQTGQSLDSENSRYKAERQMIVNNMMNAKTTEDKTKLQDQIQLSDKQHENNILRITDQDLLQKTKLQDQITVDMKQINDLNSQEGTIDSLIDKVRQILLPLNSSTSSSVKKQ